MSLGCVLVTGGAGFIGSHTCKMLAAAGIQPIAYSSGLGCRKAADGASDTDHHRAKATGRSPPILVADATLASERLGFATQLSDIDTIIRTAAPFFGLAVVEEHPPGANSRCPAVGETEMKKSPEDGGALRWDYRRSFPAQRNPQESGKR